MDDDGDVNDDGCAGIEKLDATRLARRVASRRVASREINRTSNDD